MPRTLWVIVNLVIVLAALLSGTARAEPVVPIDELRETIPLVPRTVVIDPAGTLVMTEAQRLLTAPDASVETTVRSHGYTPDTLWGRIVLDVEPAAAGRWYLSLELPNFDRLEIYTQSSPTEQPVPFVMLGDRVPEPTKIRTRFHIAPIDLPPGRTVLLVRGQTGSTLTLDLKLRQLSTLMAEEQDYFALQMFYLGVATIFGFAAIGLFAQTRQSIYLIYIINLTSHSLLWLFINGTGPGHLWPEFSARFHIDPHPFVGLTLFGTAAFAAHFLSTARVPPLVRKSLSAVAVFGLALALLSTVIPEDLIYWSSRLVSTIALPAIGVLFALTGMGLYRGEPAARPLMFTWAGLIGAIILAVMRDLGFVENNALTLSGPQLGSIFEMVVFAFMLAERLGRLQRDKEQLQRAALDTAREQEAILEHRVADRTAELDAAVQRERAARRLQQQFVAMVSHEFRAPLAIIDGAAQNIGIDNSGSGVRVEKIRSAIRRLLRMIDACLTDERVESGAIRLQREAFDLRDLAEEATDVIRAAAPDRIFDLQVPSHRMTLNADLRLSEIAISNLLENAVKYSPTGSMISTTVVAVPGGMEISVEDEGLGVPEADRDRIFEKYHRSNNASGIPGAGLGLHLARAILDAHRGSIRYSSSANGGSRFVLQFPDAAFDAGEIVE